MLEGQLFAAAGGVQTSGRWTSFGGIDWTWTSAAWLPASAVSWWCQSLAQPELDRAGALLTLAGSLVAGAALAWAAARPSRRRAVYAGALWLVWVPVPASVTWAFMLHVRF